MPAAGGRSPLLPTNENERPPSDDRNQKAGAGTESNASSDIRPAGTALIVLLSAGGFLVVLGGLMLRHRRRHEHAVWDREMSKEGVERDSFDTFRP